MTKTYILDFLQSNKEVFKRDFGLTEIGLFGSYAKDSATQDSDIDIVVQMEDKNYFKLIEFENYLKKSFDKKVDVGFLSSMKSYIKETISEDIIYV